MSIMWNQLALMEPKWTTDAELWQKYKEESRLVKLLMALRDEFESIRASILHRNPLPTVESAFSELITEETRKRIKADIPAVLAVPSRSSTNPSFIFQRNVSIPTHRDLSQVQCHNCNSQSLIVQGSTPPPGTPQCNYCKEFGHMVGKFTYPSSRNMINKRRFDTTAPYYYSSAHITAAPALEKAHESPNSTLNNLAATNNLADIQEMLKQALAIGNNTTVASTFSVPSGTFSTEWFLDSGASNHMTYNSNLFEKMKPIITPKIHTTDGSGIIDTHIG
ncbi:uncharacterized protein LOC113360255 [Papaver somniferum]|uniref:uncharacterized protein LOC113360255 n=1 Tax=Papaver somniferum TaxID=3469 RepID=UPI000E70221B|nr:uncharacterized protein LOC113360255 [Papaver somniferum]